MNRRLTWMTYVVVAVICVDGDCSVNALVVMVCAGDLLVSVLLHLCMRKSMCVGVAHHRTPVAFWRLGGHCRTCGQVGVKGGDRI